MGKGSSEFIFLHPRLGPLDWIVLRVTGYIPRVEREF